jgi:DNA invertase Pin-like site-specific DNA recombinase
MQIGYMRVSKADGSQSTDLQRDTLRAGSTRTAPPAASTRGRSSTCAISSTSFTISASSIFASLAEFERDLTSERTKAGLASARARGRKGGGPFKMTAAKVRLAMAAMGQKETKVADLCSGWVLPGRPFTGTSRRMARYVRTV